MAETLDAEKVRKVAVLARLKLSEAEIGDYATKLGNILKYVDTLNEVNTEGVVPMVHAVELSNVFRADEVQPSLPRAAALQNAPKTDGTFFLVPQILEDK
ncbi:MAG: gatC [Planctomycetaceae bacterium]|nr:gatC [Planctomycetaceae bacterium]